MMDKEFELLLEDYKKAREAEKLNTETICCITHAAEFSIEEGCPFCKAEDEGMI